MSSDVLETEEKVKEVVRTILRDKQFVVCTHGKKGAEYFSPDGKEIFQDIVEQFSPVDSNGAGDAFVSGYLYGAQNGFPAEICMKYATLVSGFTIASPFLYNKDLSVENLEQMYQQYFCWFTRYWRESVWLQPISYFVEETNKDRLSAENLEGLEVEKPANIVI